jgi:hypothetical protein
MYWFFADPGVGIGLWILSLLLILAGGWLLATHLFVLEPRERVLVGFAGGLVIYLSIVNWMGRIAPPFWTFMGGGIVVLLLGVLSAYPFKRAWLDFGDWQIGGWLAAAAVLFWVFLRISKGTGLFDEYKNLALISTLANGQIPELAHAGETQLLRYHYGFHLLGAAMMQLARFAPWSAFDVSKAMIWSLSLVLAGMAGNRYLGGRGGALLLACAVALAGGTRYLLLLLPSGLLSIIQEHVRLTGIASGSLIPALGSILPMEASPHIGYPFAFLSGIDPSYVMAHGGEQTIEPLVFMLALLVIDRPARRLSILFYALLFSFWALASETSMGLFAIGWAAFIATRYLRERRKFLASSTFLWPTIGLLIAVPLIVFQGGTIASMAQQLLHPAAASTPPNPHAGFLGFSLRWPPAIVSGQLGDLPLTDPWALLTGILETGILVVMLPWLTSIWWRRKREDWRLQVLVVIAWSGLLIPVIVRWVSEADISHLTDFAVDATVVLLVLILGSRETGLPQIEWQRFVPSGVISLVLMCVPGAVLLGLQLTAAQDTVLSAHYGDAEAQLLRQAWGRLPESSKMLGLPGPGSILTGHLTGGILSLPTGTERPIWEAMLVTPRLATLVQDRFDFVYADSRWWNSLNDTSRSELQNSCVTVFARGEEPGGGRFAEILDLRACRSP